MADDDELATLARAMIDSSLYMTLGTADETGRPWASPVYYATEDYREFIWVSHPETRHSRNLARRSDLGIVIFDSTVPINTGRGVYMSAVAEQLTGADRDQAVEIFSSRSQLHGGDAWRLADLEPPALLRLYRATAHEYAVIRPGQPRTIVTLS